MSYKINDETDIHTSTRLFYFHTNVFWMKINPIIFAPHSIVGHLNNIPFRIWFEK